MKKTLLLLMLTSLFFLASAQDKPAYILYNKNGKEVKFSKMLKELEKADMVFFGELHTDPIAHWLQYELTEALYESRGEDLVLGAEMFESDGQLIFDEYLAGIHPTDKYEAEMRLWNNYKTDYKPVVEFAKDKGIPYIATNIPRRYASLVHKGGFEALEKLSPKAKALIAPLPFPYDPELECYKNMLDMGKMGKSKKMPSSAPAMKTKPAADTTKAPAAIPGKAAPAMPAMSKSTLANLPKAQAAKDATMAHFILQNWETGKLMFHFNGSYHSRDHQGIIWYLEQQEKNLNIVTISTVLQEDISTLEDENREADYIICVPEAMTRTSR